MKREARSTRHAQDALARGLLGFLPLRHPLLRAAHLRRGTGRDGAGGGRVLLRLLARAGDRAALPGPGAGSLGAPLAGGWLYDNLGHATPFYLNTAVLLVGALLVAAVL